MPMSSTDFSSVVSPVINGRSVAMARRAKKKPSHLAIVIPVSSTVGALARALLLHHMAEPGALKRGLR